MTSAEVGHRCPDGAYEWTVERDGDQPLVFRHFAPDLVSHLYPPGGVNEPILLYQGPFTALADVITAERACDGDIRLCWLPAPKIEVRGEYSPEPAHLEALLASGADGLHPASRRLGRAGHQLAAPGRLRQPGGQAQLRLVDDPPLRRGQVAVPAPGTAGRSLHPLMAWWAVLYTPSMLARYQPAEWAGHINIDESRHAVAVESVLKRAMSMVPTLVAEAIGQAGAL
jgi:hypothetical protein